MLELVDGRSLDGPVHVPRPEHGSGTSAVLDKVRSIVAEVRLEGDAALARYTRELDGCDVPAGASRVTAEEIAAARSAATPELIEALEVMRERLLATHARQVPSDWFESSDGLGVGEVIRPLRRIGIYVPGGLASYPSSVVMGAAPALAAGVDEIAVASPPGPDGRLAPVVLAACAVAGVSEVHRMGGAQAIAALAYGTATIDPVEKIVGPGNIYVSAAKRLVSDWVGTDTEAGPTEIMVIADASADAQVIATDLIAQAEHGPHGSHVLVTWDEGLAERVMFVLEDLVARHPRAEAVENALIEGGSAVLVRDVRQALDTANAFAAEHLQLCFAGARDALPDVTSAGAIFVGPWSPVPAGDYAAGTNHVLPTHAAARFSSGLGATDFVKRVYVCELNEDALRSMSPHIEVLAEAEGLPAHADTVRVRLSGDED